MALIFDVAAVCEEGGHPGNEDSWGSRQSGALGCWIVCDGAGGHGGGETASRLAVDEVLAYWDEQPRVAVADVAQALAEANAAVMAGQLSEARLSAMRSTAVLLAVDAQTGVAAWGNVGDSRLYLFRDGREFYRSRDHSMVQQLLDAGFVTGDP